MAVGGTGLRRSLVSAPGGPEPGALLRTAATTDVALVLGVRYRAFMHHGPSAYSAEEVATLLADVDEAELITMIDGGQLFVSEQEGAVVGCAGWLDGSLRHCYVEPALVRQGLGSALVQHAEADFTARTSATEITLGAVVYAVGFYQRNGYEVVAPAIAWDGSSYYSMRKTIPR